MKKFKPRLLNILLNVMMLSTLPFLLTACESTTVKEQALYVQLGQTEGIKKLVEDFINELLIDKRIAHHFEEAELDRFHDKLVEQICELSGGPCKYSGKAMKKLHDDFEINEGQFNALVEALMLSMDSNKISVGAQNQLLALLIPMRKDIVNH
jgi:hemoglobin